MMAEFVEVMRAVRRMCKAHTSCKVCPADGECVFFMSDDHAIVEAMEKIAMDWAKAHPEAVYPSWYDWQKSNFPDAKVTICPMVFGCECKYVEAQCPECVRKPIPAEIARKLGIAPNVK